MVYHFLPEAEHFSEFKGGAISRWAANVLRNEPDSHIVCSSADDTWGFASERIHCAPNIRKYLKFRARKHYPPQISGPLLRHFYGRDLPVFQRDDVVWVHGVPAIAEALSKNIQNAGAKLVFHLHSSAFVQDSRSMLNNLQRDANLLVFCSNFLRNQALKRFPDLSKAVVLYNGADEAIFHSPLSRSRSGSLTVLFASRLVPEKGVHVLMDAMRLLERRGIDLRLKVFGASAFGGSATTTYIRELQRAPPSNVEFGGYKSGLALAQEFQAADIFCLPATYEEPLAMVLLEAIACGLPVVASSVGGVPEVISSRSGILVPPSDPEALASALAKLVASRELREEMSREGVYVFKEHFTWGRIHDAYLHLLGSVKIGVLP
jgi:spore coat protein SA